MSSLWHCLNLIQLEQFSWKIDFQDSIGIDCNKGFPDEPNTTELQQAYRLGFMRAAQWANRDDLKSDVGSPAYLKDMAEDLSK